MEEKIYNKIEAYLGGDMPPEEIILFEKQIEENSELKKEVTLYNDLNYHLGEQSLNKDFPDTEYTKTLNTFLQGDEASQVKKDLKQAKELYSKKELFFNRYKTRILSSAAVILLFIAVRVVWFPNVNSDALYLDYYNTSDLPSLVQRDDSKNALSNGVEAFQNDKFENAITIFENYEQTETDINYNMFLYKGISYSELNNVEAAIKAFDIVANSDLLDKSKGLWFKALTYLKFEDKINAKKTLGVITSNASNFKFKEAQELLKEI